MNTDAIRPNIAPPRINQVVWILNLTSRKVEITLIAKVRGSIMAARPSCQVTAAIRPNEATLTPSRKLPAQADWRSLGINGLLIATKIKDGRKIPKVLNMAPGIPPRT